MPSGELTYFESDGKSVDVTLSFTVEALQVAYVEGFLGIVNQRGDSGDLTSLNIDGREYQFTVPEDLALVKGDICYITVADLTGHIPDDTAYTNTAGAGKVPLFKATMDQVGTLCTGILLTPRAGV